MASSSGDAKAPGLSAIEEIAEGYLATAKKVGMPGQASRGIRINAREG